MHVHVIHFESKEPDEDEKQHNEN